MQAARLRLAKATALAHSRQKVTFQPRPVNAHQPDASSSKLKPKRRVSLGFALDVQTGELVEGVKRKRQSQRKHTVMNTSETVSRLRKSEAKRVRKSRSHHLQAS
jgi:vacuolar protein sorting-associated protein 72